jgi:hypothetical protein
MNTGWNLKQLRDDVERVFGQLQREAIGPSLDTIVERRRFARYHYNEAQRLLKEAIGDSEDFQIVGRILGAYDKELGDFEWARVQASAHINSCVHSMHSLADILGQVIYLGLGMNRNPATELEPRQVNAYSVRDRLPVGELQEHLHELLAHPSYIYLSALNNQSKHRSIVPVPYSVDMTGEDAEGHGLKFSAFDYDGTFHSARWVRPFLNEEYQRQEDLVMRIGNALNDAIAAI